MVSLSYDPSHDVINVRRLLNRCEEMAKDKKDKDDSWRLESYVCSLEQMINALNTKPHKPDLEEMSSFFQRLAILKGHIKIKKTENPLDKVAALNNIPKCSTETSSMSKDIEHITQSAVSNELREELLGESSDGLRKRNIFAVFDDDNNSNKDLDDLLKYHHNMQEKIADNMLSLARNIKEQSLIAGNIIRNDTFSIEKSSRMAEKNMSNLKVQSEKLQENTRRTCQCWIWILIIVVIAVFINMVLLMKVTKKRI